MQKISACFSSCETTQEPSHTYWVGTWNQANLNSRSIFPDVNSTIPCSMNHRFGNKGDPLRSRGVTALPNRYHSKTWQPQSNKIGYLGMQKTWKEEATLRTVFCHPGWCWIRQTSHLIRASLFLYSKITLQFFSRPQRAQLSWMVLFYKPISSCPPFILSDLHLFQMTTCVWYVSL